jgi:vancomycin resistance protein YoaR
MVVAVAIAAGAAMGAWLVPRAPTPPKTPAAAPAVTLLGRPLRLDDEAPKLALERVRRFAAGTLTLDLPDGRTKRFRMGRVGVQIDKVRLAHLVRDAGDATSPLRQTWQRANRPAPIALPVPVELDSEPLTLALLELKDQLDRLPADARLDLERRKLVKEVVGRLLDVDATLQAVEAALQRGEAEATVVFEDRRPRRVAAELGNVAFDHVLGFFETRYDRSRRYRARTFNLRLAASKLDGTVLMPGETFDFNEGVGPRDEANGYKVAPVIAEGEVVDGIGGGTCQISGTLHGAAFFAGLDIVERHPHTRPSSYIKMGLDATVVYPAINFRIRNPHGFPVVLHETVKNGTVRAEVLGPKRDLTVTYIRHIDSAIPYEQVERPDDRLPRGRRVLGQRGVPGFRLHRYRILRDGAHAVRERFDDVYPPTTQIIRVGTGDIAADKVKARDDPHPEYTADEVLIMTQGPRIVDDAGVPTTFEDYERGRTGTPGWTEEAGMPVWKGGEE